jgi:hypothetical protein
MADKPPKDDPTVEVPMTLLTAMQEQMAELERKVADNEAKNAGLEELLSKQAETTGENKLREKKNFEPKFRTVRVRKYPMGGDETNLGWVIGWSNRGAYQTVDRTGISPQIVDMIDLVFLGHEKTKEGKLQVEQVKLLDFMNKGIQIHCKILEKKVEPVQIPTNEEIDVTIFDPAHGLTSTGEKIDGYITHDEIKYKIQIPGIAEPVWIDSLYANA